jgi:hypothetical protein
MRPIFILITSHRAARGVPARFAGLGIPEA